MKAVVELTTKLGHEAIMVSGFNVTPEIFLREEEVNDDDEDSMTTIQQSHPTSRIAFGSCNDQDMQNNLWNRIDERNPAAFIWGGDAIYAGTFCFSVTVKSWHRCCFASLRTTVCLTLLPTYRSMETDINGPKDWSTFPPTSNPICATPGRLKQLYYKQRKVPEYQKLLEKNVTIFGTYDGTVFRHALLINVLFVFYENII